jgi:protoporphyrinogen/coproporphyrinogen III oxidase
MAVADAVGAQAGPGAEADVVVVGAGIAGLTAAWHLRHLRLLVLEAAGRPGGRIRSEPRGDYWLNFGPHLFPGPDTVLGRLVTSAGLHTSAVTGSTLALSLAGRLLTSGRTWSYPLRLPMFPSARASLIRAGLAIRRGVRAYLELGQTRPGDTAADVRQRLLSFEDDRSFADHLGPLHPDADAILRAAITRLTDPVPAQGDIVTLAGAACCLRADNDLFVTAAVAY